MRHYHATSLPGASRPFPRTPANREARLTWECSSDPWQEIREGMTIRSAAWYRRSCAMLARWLRRYA